MIASSIMVPAFPPLRTPRRIGASSSGRNSMQTTTVGRPPAPLISIIGSVPNKRDWFIIPVNSLELSISWTGSPGSSASPTTRMARSKLPRTRSAALPPMVITIATGSRPRPSPRGQATARSRHDDSIYDAVGNKRQVTFPDNNTQQWDDYDAFGQAWKFTDERHNGPI